MGNFSQRGSVSTVGSADLQSLPGFSSRAGTEPRGLLKPFHSIRSAFDAVSFLLPVAQDDCINVSALSLPYLLSAMDGFASLGHFACYWAGRNSFAEISSSSASTAGRLARRGRVEMLVVDNKTRLLDAFSVRFWMPRAENYHTADARAPIRHLPLDLNIGTPVPTEYSIDFPIDAVIAWVDGADPNWRRLISEHIADREIDYDRYTSNDELRFCIRSIEMFAPWIRTIHILSNCEPPSWFKRSDRVKWVDHTDFGDPRVLPLFNSHSIELMMSGIPGLSEQFIYFNDDMVIGKPCRPSDFFMRDGTSISRLEPYGRVLEFRGAQDLPEWQMAAANGARLILEKFGFYPTRLHQHVPYALRKSVLAEMEAAFPKEVGGTRAARFRSPDDISPVSFLYHHFAIASGKAIAGTATSFIVRATNFLHFKRKFEAGETYDHICINDGDGSHAHEKYTKFKRDFLPRLAPFKASCESESAEVRGPSVEDVLGKVNKKKAQMSIEEPEPLSAWRRPLHRMIAIAVSRHQSKEDRRRFRRDPVEYLRKAKVPANRFIGKILLRSDQRPY